MSTRSNRWSCRVCLGAALAWSAGCSVPSGVAPNVGRGSGGESIRIVGDGFRGHGPPVVYVGPRSAKAVVVENDGLITAITPEADGPGQVDVSVHFADGEVRTYAGAFTYGERGVVLRVGDRE